MSHSLNGIPPLQRMYHVLLFEIGGVSQPKRHPAPATAPHFAPIESMPWTAIW